MENELSMRDRFAIEAMKFVDWNNALKIDRVGVETYLKWQAERAYIIADKMINAREKDAKFRAAKDAG